MNKTPAYSLVFAFLIMTVIMLVAGTTIENTHDKVIYFREIEGTAQARLAAESAAELAVMEIRDAELGFDPASVTTTAGDNVFCLEYDSTTSATSTDDCKAWASYDVRSVAETNEVDGLDYIFYTPIPGTGSAGLSDECSILDSDLAPDHPCNWNKLMYGQSVTVPLYADDGADYPIGGTFNASELGMNAFYLRLRTPCMDDEYSSSCIRYVFPGDGANDKDGDLTFIPSDDDPSVILWQIYGEDTYGNAILSVPDDAASLGARSWARDLVNTEIYQSLINDASASDYIIMTVEDDASSTFYEDVYQKTMDPDVENLFLQFDIISLLIDENGDSIPYLEWQIIYDTYLPFATPELSVVGSGYYEGESGTFYFPYVVSRSSTGESTNIYTLSN